MLVHIKLIDWILGVEEGNVAEAEKYVKKAHRMKHENKGVADWCIEMARKHLDFNDNRGDMMLDDLCQKFNEVAGGTELHTAMRQHVHNKRAWIAEETAEVRTMIEMYGR